MEVPARVKVYQLTESGEWDCKGTGNCSASIADDGEGEFVIIAVLEEETDEILLEHRVHPEAQYNRQTATLLVWTDTEDDTELSLSFAETQRCEELFDLIMNHLSKKGKLPPNMDGSADTSSSGNSNLGAVSSSSSANGSLGGVPNFSMPTLANLSELDEKINVTHTKVNGAGIADQILGAGYLQQLFSVFFAIEADEEDDGEAVADGREKRIKKIQEAQNMFNFVKGMFLLNDKKLLEVLLSEENILSVISCLEYDPLLSPLTTPSFRRHRDFLLQKAQLKQLAVKIENVEVISRIHLTYRMIYIRDVILLKYLDDSTIKTITDLIVANNHALLKGLLGDERWTFLFFEQLHTLAGLQPNITRTKLKEGKEDHKRKEIEEEEEDDLERLEQMFQRKNMFSFLQELSNMIRTMHPDFQANFYSFLTENSALDAVERVLSNSFTCFSSSEFQESKKEEQNEENLLWLSCIEILMNSLVYDSSFLRNYLIDKLDEGVKGALMSSLVDMLISPTCDSGLADQIGQVLRMVLAPENMTDAEKKSDFLDDFYAKQAPKLLLTISQPLTKSGSTGSKTTFFTLNNPHYHACELLSYCVYRHEQRASQFVIKHNITSKMSELIKSPRANIVCTGVRFLRACLTVKDARDVVAIARQMSSSGALDEVMRVFAKNGARYNLLNSTIIEFVHYIRTENIKTLIEYLVSKHEDKFQGIEYVSTFQELKIRHEQNEEYLRNPRSARNRSRTIAPLDTSEYSYFERDSDEENEAPQKMDQEKLSEYKLDLELLKQRRPERNADDEADLVSGPRARMLPTINMNNNSSSSSGHNGNIKSSSSPTTFASKNNSNSGSSSNSSNSGSGSSGSNKRKASSKPISITINKRPASPRT